VTEQEVYETEVEALYGKWAGKIWRFLVGLGCEEGLAEEITADAFLVACRRWPTVRLLDKPEGYVFKVARHVRSRRQPAHDARARDLHPDPTAFMPAAHDFTKTVADRDAVLRALQRLPPRMREAVVLRYVAGLSSEEAATVMGITEGAVRNLACRGLEKLRDDLNQIKSREE
jgi:RNA polymerase sigma factor (sigma-70 family)